MSAPLADAWRVFAQRDEPHVEIGSWTNNAKRFFEADITASDVTETAATLSVGGEARAVLGRMRDEDDLRDALEADNAAGGGGLYDLAERRCRVVWQIERRGASDRTALLLAAVIASVGLGPIIGRSPPEIFGVRSAREKIKAAL